MSLIEDFFKTLKTGDLEALLALIHPKAEIIGVRETADDRMPIYGTFRGPDGMRAFVDILRSSFETELFEVDTIMEDDIRGFACGRFRHKVRMTGRLFVSNWALYAEFQDGKISLYRFHEDTAALEAAFGVTTAKEAA